MTNFSATISGKPMFHNFEYKEVSLRDIFLDERNPRIVTQKRLKTQEEIISYLFEHEKLSDFIKKVSFEGKNRGSERPYVVKAGETYTVIEGNTRIAAYKLLTGLISAPAEHANFVPALPEEVKESLLVVDCTIAPNRDALLPIMANSHFGLGDKSPWGFLGSRKAVYEEWKSGKNISQLTIVFNRKKNQIIDLIIEYILYTKAINMEFQKKEKDKLLNPSVEFNPPIRFLQTRGHKNKMGIMYDKTNLDVIFTNSDSEAKFKHLIKKLVIYPEPKLGATASYDEVFRGFEESPNDTGAGPVKPQAIPNPSTANNTSTTSTAGSSNSSTDNTKTTGTYTASQQRSGVLFTYSACVNNNLLNQLMREARELSYKKYPASSTFLLRNIVEALLKHIIHDQQANQSNRALDLEACLNLCLSNVVTLSNEDKKILKEFYKHHLPYLNLGAHGNVIPNSDRVLSARDCIDQFVRKHV